MKLSIFLCLILLTLSTGHGYSLSQDSVMNYWIQQAYNEDIFTRVDAIGTLGEYTTSAAIQTLLDVMCHDREFYLREKAAKSLILIGRPAIEPVIPYLKNENFEIRSLALWILEEVTDLKFGFDTRKWVNWWKKEKTEKKKSK